MKAYSIGMIYWNARFPSLSFTSMIWFHETPAHIDVNGNPFTSEFGAQGALEYAQIMKGKSLTATEFTQTNI